MTERVLSVEIYSDVICPWCYVGKRRFERAVRQMGTTVKTHVAWRPFQLNPTMPKDGMDRTAYLAAKFGSLERFKEMEQRLLDAGRAEHISFAFEKIARTPNTFLAHRLIWYSGIKGRQDAVVDRLFKGYFEEGLDIGSLSILAELADRAGLNASEFLTSEEGAAEVKAEESVGHTLGIRGVPYFIFGKIHGISGAQPVEVFVSAMEKARTGPPIAGGS
ncbi:MAG: 2-hydroxychromene-2-carboxylate isomerase/DsbA-like thioredoxin domain [Nitrospira sp.]|jgi:predicted DsbA family dithiol-disulfide isomerase|nr:MAG: 2-hydroxychromene-2-carboxylate isomerase/DsbA-like thioredoxin domain [Nitrospira sp.]